MNPLTIMSNIGNTISEAVKSVLNSLSDSGFFTSNITAKIVSMFLLILATVLFVKTVKTASTLIRWIVIIVMAILIISIGVSFA